MFGIVASPWRERLNELWLFPVGWKILETLRRKPLIFQPTKTMVSGNVSHKPIY
jgi:hypothetical protein